ncbi:hypothetical protein Ndes2437B_g04997 [Nannochloris sp. 'desiccata']
MSTKKPNPYHIDFLKPTKFAYSLVRASCAMRQVLVTLVATVVASKLIFSQVSGIHFNFEKSSSEPKAGYKVTIQLSSPALTYVGNQGMNRFKKTNAVYEAQQTDFSCDGAVKKARTHSFTVDNLNRLKTMKQRMEQHGFAAAIAAGLDESLLTASFTEEEVEASFEKTRSNGNTENIGNNHNSDTEDAGDDGEASAAVGAPKPRAPPQPKRSNPKAVPGLLDSMPEDPGPWLQTCVERWNLIAPFDPTVPDEIWESYYRERAALDWFIKEAKGLQIIWDDEMALGKKEAKSTPAWTEDFPKPPMYAYCDGSCYVPYDTPQNHIHAIGKALKKVVEGCPQLTDDAENIGDKLASSIYVLNGSTNWDDDSCRTFNCQIRLYSPYGLATAVDLKMKWHYRARMTFAEHFSTVNFAVRAAEDINHLEPQKSAADDKSNRLFFMDRANSGYLKRTLAPLNKLRAAEEALFGRKNLISERKMFNILMHAATSVDCRCVTDDLKKNMAPFSRRKWKKFVGETGCTSEDDYDSENEEKKKNTKGKRAKLREVFGAFPVGSPLGGYGGDDSDEEEEREECTIM